jgi:hypothetical protein
MKKKIVLAVVSAIVLTGFIFVLLAYFEQGEIEPPEVETINYKDKIVLSDYRLIAVGDPPGIRANIELSGAVVQGQIIKAEGMGLPFATGTPLDDKIADMQPDGQLPEWAFTKYTMEVEKHILGDKTENIIEFILQGGLDSLITKPKGDERVVLFLERVMQGHPLHPEGFYTPSMMEHSVFTIDENGRLYSFSNTRELSAFDGKPVSALIDEIERVAKDLERNPLGQ